MRYFYNVSCYIEMSCPDYNTLISFSLMNMNYKMATLSIK